MKSDLRIKEHIGVSIMYLIYSYSFLLICTIDLIQSMIYIEINWYLHPFNLVDRICKVKEAIMKVHKCEVDKCEF